MVRRSLPLIGGDASERWAWLNHLRSPTGFFVLERGTNRCAACSPTLKRIADIDDHASAGNPREHAKCAELATGARFEPGVLCASTSAQASWARARRLCRPGAL